MSVLVGSDTRLVIQGITGTEGTFHGQQMIDYGTNIVAGVTPGKGGQEALGVPVFNAVSEAVQHKNANAAVVLCRQNLPPVLLLKRSALVWIWSYVSLRAFQP